VTAFCVAVLNGEVGVEENTSKVFVGGDANLAAATLMTASGTGTSLFVINLCASMAPAPNVGKTLPGLESYRLYQVARREDGRTRYRLRLGFFTSKAEADAVLNSVRDAYPTAFTACLCDEDQKFARGFATETGAPAPVAAAPKMSVVENKPVAKITPAKPAAPVVAAPKPAPPVTAPIAKAATVTRPAQTAKAEPASTVPAALAATATSTAPAPRVDTTSTGMFKLTPQAIAHSVSKPTGPVATKAAAPLGPVEIDLNWDLPALEPTRTAAHAAPTQVIAPGFKTQDVIKAPAAPTAAPAAPSQIAATKAPAAKPAAPTPLGSKQTIEAPSKLLASIELTLESEPTPVQKSPPAAASSEPFRVGKGVEIPTSSLSLQAESASAAAPSGSGTASASSKPIPTPMPPAPAQPARPLAEVAKMKAAHATASTSIKAAVAPPPARKVDGPAPDLDTTQTIRALTTDELKDESQEKWFAIQLAASDQPVNLDAMPRLDIFEAYRVYSVASAGSGKITHSLRIGFFREEVSAEAVSGYLKTFFASPSVVRISIAEQARFKDPIVKPAAKEAKVLDLSHARERAPKTIPTVTMEVESPKFDPSATGSFKPNATGVHRALSTGAHKALSATGTHKTLNATGMHKALTATGTHKTLKVASKSAPPATKRSEPVAKGATGRHKTLQPKRSLSEQLMDEAREVELSASGIRKLPKSDSLLAKMFGKKK
jgi:SPOR domain